MMEQIDKLKKQVCLANRRLADTGLVVLTWGNVSGRTCNGKRMVIKPSGVPYSRLSPQDMVVMSVESGEKSDDGAPAPSSDTPTHIELYRAFPGIGGIVHTHSTYATAWAQAGRPVPCLGTTHADTFCGEVPLCRPLDEEEVRQDYESCAGKAIVELFGRRRLDPLSVPGVLLPGHGPFTWGADADSAVENAIILEEVARIAYLTLNLQPGQPELPQHLLDKHFYRKHGPDAYYGQKETSGR